jgi:hypothetical protein
LLESIQGHPMALGVCARGFRAGAASPHSQPEGEQNPDTCSRNLHVVSAPRHLRI